MTFYEELKRQIDTKGHVVVRSDIGSYQVFSWRDDGDYLCSEWWDTLKEAKNHIGYGGSYSLESINGIAQKNSLEIVESFSFEPKPFQVGETVVDEDGEEFEVVYGADFPAYTLRKDNCLSLKYHHQLSYPIKKTTKKMTVADVCKELGYEVEIIK